MEPLRRHRPGTFPRRVALILATAAVLAVPGAMPARAQDAANPEVQSLTNRLDRLQRDMDALQRQVYRGGGTPPATSGGSGASVSGGGGAVGEPAEPNLAAAMQVRLDDIETQMQSFTGRLEETNHAIAELQKKLEVLSSDVDLRLKALEARGGAPGTAAGAASASSGPPPVTAAPSSPGVLGTLPLNDVGKNGGAGANPSSEGKGDQTAAVLPKGTSEEQYRYATSMLAKSDWAGAEKALDAFLAAHPKDPLAGNAQYWLGETFYARGDYNNAALAFAKGYKNFPKSQKGPDNLLKLGMSLANLKKTKSACATFDRVGKDFPKASSAIKSHVAAERKKLHCR